MNLFREEIQSALNNLDDKKIYEIRIRNSQPIIVNYGQKKLYLTRFGVSTVVDNCIYALKNEAESIVLKASDYSLYSVENQLYNGFLSLDDGRRIGVCGEVVKSAKGYAFRNYNSVLIRYPHQVVGCANSIFKYVFKHDIRSVLISSKPGGGKTTVIRDLIRQLSVVKNVYVIDERNEICGMKEGFPKFNVGNCDVSTYGNKKISISSGIRSLSPDYVVCDEIGKDEVECIEDAMNCGVGFIGSIHAGSIDEIKRKKFMENVIADHAFELFVVLGKNNVPGTIDKTYDCNFNEIEI